MHPSRVLAGSALLVLLLTAGCGSDSSDATATPPGTTAGSPSLQPSSAPTSQPGVTTAPGSSSASASSGPDALQLTLTVAGGKVTGSTGTVDVPRNKAVHLTVTSDVADEVHVHGADVHADVPAGGTVTLDFVQKAPGRFEIELESRKLVLARLQVS